MGLNKNIVLTESVLGTEIDNETILLDMESENYFGFDSVGSDIWRLLKEGKTLKQTYDALLEIYEVEPEVLKKDLLEFVGQLEKNGLINVS